MAAESAMPVLPDSLKRLRRFAEAQPPSNERCELCSAPLTVEHSHLVEPEARRLLCCCDSCAVLFSNQHQGRYRRVTRDIWQLADFRMTDLQWENLGIPIGLAFLFYSTPAQRVVAVYPSPAGATDSLPSLDAWEELAEANPVLRNLEPDTEALLVNRSEGARDYFRVPIDRCYQLAGLIRAHWRGISGGPQVRAEINRFFVVLREQGRPHA